MDNNPYQFVQYYTKICPKSLTFPRYLLCVFSVSFDEFICCSRKATLPFAKGSAVVREEQRGRSRTVNKSSVHKQGKRIVVPSESAIDFSKRIQYSRRRLKQKTCGHKNIRDISACSVCFAIRKSAVQGGQLGDNQGCPR